MINVVSLRSFVWNRTEIRQICLCKIVCLVLCGSALQIGQIFIAEKMQPGGQSLVDRLLAAKNTIAGQLIAKVVCKATTEEMNGPKRKHLDCESCSTVRSFVRSIDFLAVLVQATNEMNVSIPEMADLLIERAQNSSWVVSLKALVSIHHLMCYGNEVR
jgi:hypothetical protein